jgi:transcriptional regulator with XRE-family HTH domain
MSLISQADKRILKLLGNRVREIREKKKLSVYDITGEDMSIKSRQHWQAIENGQKNVNITTAFKVARTLEVDAEELFRGLSNKSWRD